MAVGATETLTLTFTVGPTAPLGPDQISVSASVSGLNETDSDPGNDAAGDSTDVNSAIFDLEVVTTESADPVLAASGPGNLVYVATVTNLSSTAATGVTVENFLTLPGGVTIDSISPSVGNYSAPIWNLGELAPFAMETITITLTVGGFASPADTVTYSAGIASVNETDENPINDADDEETAITRLLDFGDAMDPAYPSKLASDGARHVIAASSPLIGTTIDDEADAQTNATATGDDTTGSDDEDGILFSTGALVRGESSNVEVTITDAGATSFLSAWIDFDGDGTWTPSEQIAADFPVAPVSGTNTVNIGFAVPATAQLGSTVARVRVSSQGGLAPTGIAIDGEVEDIMTPPITSGPSVESVTIDNGTGQRSMVRDITVRFDTVVTVDPGAFSVTDDSSNPVSFSQGTPTVVDGKTEVTLTFNAPGLIGGSLADGNYSLNVDKDKVRVGSSSMLADHVEDFFRFFGDRDGDRDVDLLDFVFFKATFNLPSSDPFFNDAFDFQGDDDVDLLDFVFFKGNFSSSLPN